MLFSSDEAENRISRRYGEQLIKDLEEYEKLTKGNFHDKKLDGEYSNFTEEKRFLYRFIKTLENDGVCTILDEAKRLVSDNRRNLITSHPTNHHKIRTFHSTGFLIGAIVGIGMGTVTGLLGGAIALILSPTLSIALGIYGAFAYGPFLENYRNKFSREKSQKKLDLTKSIYNHINNQINGLFTNTLNGSHLRMHAALAAAIAAQTVAITMAKPTTEVVEEKKTSGTQGIFDLNLIGQTIAFLPRSYTPDYIHLTKLAITQHQYDLEENGMMESKPDRDFISLFDSIKEYSPKITLTTADDFEQNQDYKPCLIEEKDGTYSAWGYNSRDKKWKKRTLQVIDSDHFQEFAKSNNEYTDLVILTTATQKDGTLKMLTKYKMFTNHKRWGDDTSRAVVDQSYNLADFSRYTYPRPLKEFIKEFHCQPSLNNIAVTEALEKHIRENPDTPLTKHLRQFIYIPEKSASDNTKPPFHP